MKIKISWARPYFTAKEQANVRKVMTSTWLTRGPFAKKFEEQFTAYHKVKYGLAVANGTVALRLALLACKIGPKDEVIVPSLTFAAVANMVIASGAKPVYVDIDPRTWCLDPEKVAQAVTRRTKAIIAVHLYGNVCDLTRLKAIAQKRKLFLIEDTAEAIFSKYRGRYAGTWGDVGCFSFHAAKTITMGEGGFVMTRSKTLFTDMQRRANQAMVPGRHYWHDRLGFNFRLTDLQAAVGCGQLENLPQILKAKQKVYETYKTLLAGEPGLTLQSFSTEVEPLVWAPAIKLDHGYFPQGRDRVLRQLREKGVEARPGFYPFHQMPFYRAKHLPVAEHVGRNTVVLPLSAGLTTRDIKFICQMLKSLRKG
jgi:perosamine synthetase